MKGDSPSPITPRERAAERSRSWRNRRSELLQEVCIAIAERIAKGAKTGQAIKEVARRFRNRSLGNGRSLNLSSKSAERIFYDFLKHGESAFALRYVAGRKQEIDPLLLQLVIQSAIRQSKSVSKILVGAGISNRKGGASLTTIYRALPAKEINQFLRTERSLTRQRKRAEERLIQIQQRLRALRDKAVDNFPPKGLA